MWRRLCQRPHSWQAAEGRRGAGRAALRDAADLAERRDLEQLDAAFVQLALLRTNALKSGASRQQRQSKVTHFPRHLWASRAALLACEAAARRDCWG